MMATISLGVARLFRHAVDMERRTGDLWDNRASAEAVIDHLAAAIEGVTNLPGMPAIKKSGNAMICQVGLERRRYLWHADDSTSQYVLECQSMLIAGTKNMTLQDVAPENLDKPETWERIRPVVLAYGVEGILIQFMPLKEPSVEWKSNWNGAVGNIAVRVQVCVGGQTAERIIRPSANATVVGHET